MDLLGKAATDIVFSEIATAGVRFALSDAVSFWADELPEAVVLKAPERIFGMVCSPGRAELLEKLTKCALGLAVRYEPGLAAAAPSEGVEEQEWLVGRPFVAASPHCDLGDSLADSLRVHILWAQDYF